MLWKCRAGLLVVSAAFYCIKELVVFMRAKLVNKNKNEFEFNYCNYILFVVVVIFSSYCSFLSYVLFLFLPIFLFGFSFCFFSCWICCISFRQVQSACLQLSYSHSREVLACYSLFIDSRRNLLHPTAWFQISGGDIFFL